MSEVTGDMTLDQARVWLAERVNEGVRCPCCAQMAREYRRKLNQGMAAALVRMYMAHGTAWQLKTETLKGVGPAARDESLLRHWGLLEESQVRREDGGRAGWWRVTDKGEMFVLGHKSVNSHIVLYANEFRGYHGDLVTIYDCIDSAFSLAELMAEGA